MTKGSYDRCWVGKGKRSVIRYEIIITQYRYITKRMVVGATSFKQVLKRLSARVLFGKGHAIVEKEQFTSIHNKIVILTRYMYETVNLIK